MERTPSTKFLCWWFGVSYPCALVMVLRFGAPLISVDPFEGAFEGSLRIFEGAFEQGTKRKSRFGANHSSKNPCCSMVPLQSHARQAQVQTLDGYGSTQNERPKTRARGAPPASALSPSAPSPSPPGAYAKKPAPGCGNGRELGQASASRPSHC